MTKRFALYQVTSHAFGKDLLRAVGFTLDVEAGSWVMPLQSRPNSLSSRSVQLTREFAMQIFSASLEKLAATCRVLQAPSLSL